MDSAYDDLSYAVAEMIESLEHLIAALRDAQNAADRMRGL